MTKLLLVEDKDSLGRMLRETLEADGYELDWARSGSEAIRKLQEGRRYGAVLTDLRLPGQDGIEVLRQSKQIDPECPVLVMTGFGTIETAVEAMKIGAYDFVQKPLDVDHLLILLRRSQEHRQLRVENLLLKEEVQKKQGFPEIIGQSPEILAVSEQIRKVAGTDSTVLLQGESGTGKELFARAIRQLSKRVNRPFVAINCAAIPATLIENELFGHEKGAYTGAGGRQMGKFELADSGTIFLDEISELELSVQSKILRVLQERKFERVGGVSTIDVDIRIICATNRNLHEAVREGRFREDLFYRVNVFPVVIPPLRARRSDIDALSDHFARKFGKEIGKPEVSLSEEARAALRNYDWPGNIRELENCIERAVILCEGNRIAPDDLGLHDRSSKRGSVLREWFDFSGSLDETMSRVQAAVEKMKIEDALRDSSSRTAAAELLGISYRTLLSKIREYELGASDGEDDGT